MNSVAKKVNLEDLSITEVSVTSESLIAKISDGRSVSIPLSWFPRLKAATSHELNHFEISPGGYGIHWPEIDEDISIKAFINP